MKRLIMLIEVADESSQQLFYGVMQQMIEDHYLEGYFTLVDHGEPIDDLPYYMAYELETLIPCIAEHEQKFVNNPSLKNKHGTANNDPI